MKNFALIVAAGNGSRLQMNKSKILTEISDKPLIFYTINTFEKTERIDGIILVIRTQDKEEVSEIVKSYRFKKIRGIVSGGATRQDSVYSGLHAITEKEAKVCIHDGARPFIRKELIQDALKAFNQHKYQGLIFAVPVKETIKQVSEDDQTMISSTIPRKYLWVAQTPQIFPLGYIRQVYQQAFKAKLSFTDDASAVEYFGGKIKIYPGTDENIKITVPLDIVIAEVLIKKEFYEL